jgi:16S rRNA (adenine1518-N6/adenine1519-N6)-dimethyltransferase
MPLYRPSELSAFLASLYHVPKRTLSQNFLIDGNIVEKIIAEAGALPGSLVLEIGPGPGVLTEALLKSGAKIVAVEKDDALAAALQRLDPEKKRLSVVAADILDCSLPEIAAAGGAKEMIVVSNLPYHLTSPIIQKLIDHAELFSKAVLMMQEEAACRLIGAKPSFIGLAASFFADVKYSFPVPKGCFWPRPKVDSAVLTLRFRPPRLEKERHEQCMDILRMAFSHRRKTVIHSLLHRYGREDLAKAFQRIHLPLDSRPEEIPLDGWIDLAHELPLA